MQYLEFAFDLFAHGKPYSFFRVFTASDGTILRCIVETHNQQMNPVKRELDIIFHDSKKRRTKTLEAAGITESQLRSGIEEKAGMLTLSEYFIDYNYPIIGYGISSKLKKINDRIAMYQYKTIDCQQIDLTKAAKECGIRCISQNEEALLRECLKCYEKVKRLEENKFGCVVNYVYHMTLEYGKTKDMIYCDTTIGRISYDIEDDTWSMSQAEMKKTGHRIENFDIEDIKRQIRQRYKVRNMSELVNYLSTKENWSKKP